MKILTGNDLQTGDVVWWDGAAAGRAMSRTRSTSASMARRSLAREEAARRVNGPMSIDAERDAGGPAPGAHQGPHPRARPDRAPRPDAQARRSRRRQLGDLNVQVRPIRPGDRRCPRRGVPRPGAPPPRGRADRGPVQAAAAEERPLPAAPRLHAARRDSLWHARQPRRCACWRTSRASTTAATAISPRGRTSSTTGSSWRRRPTSSPIWPTVEMHAIQTSGNCIRNISLRPVRRRRGRRDRSIRARGPRCCARWSTFHPEFSYLPRKFKIAVIAADDRPRGDALHDIGVRIVRNDAGEIGFEVFVGGGMGRTPMIAPRDPRLRADRPDLLSYLEACLRVYNRYGRRDNIYKARIKILVHELGAEEYTPPGRGRVRALPDARASTPPQAEFDRIAAYFAPPPFETGPARRDRPLRSRLRALGRPATSPRTSSRATRSSTSA